MITNEKQYRSTRALLEQLRQSLVTLSESADIHPTLLTAQRSALFSQIEELTEEVELYERLRSGQIANFEAAGLQELPDILIQARIARGMSQKDLGEFLGLKEQQIQRYEAERYRAASLERLIEIAEALDVHISETASLSGSGGFENISTAAIGSFPIAEMYKRGWFEDFSGSLAEARTNAHFLVPNFFRNARTHWPQMAFHRKSVRSSGKVHEAAIAAWEARVITLADRKAPVTQFDRNIATKSWVADLVHLSIDIDGPRRAAERLWDAGIVLVIEPHLPGTLLDGAALQTSRDIAVIGMTLRHDRLDNFWFTLFHEIAHLVLHIEPGQFASIFDDIEAPAGSDIERQADIFAQEALLPKDKWDACVSRFSRSERAILTDAKRFGINPAIIAGRIRREAGDYTILRGLVGAGEVRRQFVMEKGDDGDDNVS